MLLLAAKVAYYFYSSKKRDKENQLIIKRFLEDYKAMTPTRYSYLDLKRITNDFKEQLGEGAYGTVFKGKISDQILVAVKLLHDISTRNGDQEFINEVATMGRIHHVNVVRLIGFSADGFRRALVYEFLPNGSLDKFISARDNNNNQWQNAFGFEKMQDTALGIARGIEYLHQGCEQRILHFDIKPQNILLDDNFIPKISDFGLAKLCEKGKSAVSMTAARGTMGYMAPEVYSRHFGNVSYKSDIYSFGMLLLEMIGRKKYINERVHDENVIDQSSFFSEWVYKNLVNEEEDIEIQVERSRENEIERKLAIVGLWCIQWKPMDRPCITFVLRMLEEENGENLNLPPTLLPSTNLKNSAVYRRHLDSNLEVISE
ncbi:hypothetical protein M9H77_28089 [Catharanthus roseus]|uniref:Uncharacterized protein n=1 Tax=Catharanthus roseus TaxID=4058 RepID=A0ACC0AIH3_CATRO|nr:hypothetical protein M9H77_28089 [Catharanthus roseus]